MAEVITLQQSDINYSYSEFLPDVVRVVDAGYEIDAEFRVCYVATVYGNAIQLPLSWTSACPDERIAKGALARVFWPAHLGEVDGLYPINRLVPLTAVDHSINLFETVPSSWSRQFDLLDRAKALWGQLPCRMQAIFNELFWDVDTFRHYIYIPASINSHHNGWGGNLRHSVEMAEHAERIALDVEGVSNDLLILAGLLCNAPDAEAYIWKEGQWGQAGLAVVRATRQRFEARLHAILEHRPNLLNERERQILWQILFGRDTENHGSREQPMTALETEILKMADRLSCVLNLRGQGGVP